MVAKYDSDLKEFKFNYQNIMIKQYGVDWVAQYGNRAEIEHVNIKMIQDGTDIHQRAEGRVKAHHREKEEITKETLKKQANIFKPEDVEMTDLDEASIVNG